ncbi:unnamed protein product [Darwinula stevensoni]|uniref:Uncharacterized protein n=1 Tax=Darwinula stevensoni TaxID=69355 RepID=A0A7R8X6L1_9CRUS|nr:unnamed protein product [Darwinula stevensoni]CAG0886981.1 unnamed protein product [Darwinula stevensoni]
MCRFKHEVNPMIHRGEGAIGGGQSISGAEADEDSSQWLDDQSARQHGMEILLEIPSEIHDRPCSPLETSEGSRRELADGDGARSDLGASRENNVIGMDQNETGIIQRGIREVGRLFYLADPWETSFEKPEEVPDYVTQAVPYFFLGIILEIAILWKQGKPPIRLDDGMASMAGGFLMEITRSVGASTS